MKEYKIIENNIKNVKIEERLNDLANEGWEVVCSMGVYNYKLVLVRDLKENRIGVKK